MQEQKGEKIMVFKERLKELRLERGMSQKALAHSIGMSERNIQEIEYGKVDPKLSNVMKLAAVLQVSMDDLTCFHLDNEI